MDIQAAAQIEQAIEAAFNARSSPTLKAQAFDFLSQLRSEPQAWQICLSLSIGDSRPSDVVRLVCLDIVNTAIQTRQLSNEDLNAVKVNIMSYIQNVYCTANNFDPESNPIQNKLTQTLTYLFMSMYHTAWTSFFHDLLALTVSPGSSQRDNPVAIRLYLRVLMSIHDEIGDTLVPRTPDEQKRDNELKDLIRQRDVQMIASVWHDILSQWKSSDDLVDFCLLGMSRWVSWIDISLVVNDALISLLFELLDPQNPTDNNSNMQERRGFAISTFSEILAKKMSAADKLELMDVLKIKDAIAQLLNSRALKELRASSDYDTDLAEDVAKLTNTAVCEIVRALDGASDNDAVSKRGIAELQYFVNPVLRFLSDEYDEICATVITCLTDLLTLMRKKNKSKSNFVSETSNILPLILDAVIAKMKYDETSFWGNEDTQTDEAEFQDLRRRLHVLQQAVAAVDVEMYVTKITNLVISTLDRYQTQRTQVDWRDVDLALHELSLFHEQGLMNGGLYSKTKPASSASEHLISMIQKLVECDVASFPHPAIHLQYMEICVKYFMFFEANPQYISRVLEKFVLFVHHDHPKVRMRSWNLLHRFVKHVRSHVGNVAETLVQSLGNLLTIKAEVSEVASDNDEHDASSSDNGQNTVAVFNSQLNLYEAVGCICSARTVPVETQVMLLSSVIKPLSHDIRSHLNQAVAHDKRAILQIHHLIKALGTLSQGFAEVTLESNTPNIAPPAVAVSEEFAQAAEAILVALECLPSSFEVRDAARFSFSRLIGVLGSGILPGLPRWIDSLLSRTSTKGEMAMFMGVLGQVVFRFKAEIFDILNTLLTPFLQLVFAGISEPVEGYDEVQLEELKRAYLDFLLRIFNSNLEAVFVSEVNQPIFGTVISTIEHLARDATDLKTASRSFSVLIRMVSTWGGPDVTSQAGPPVANGAAPQKLEGFDGFMMTRLSPLCWALPANPAFDAKDAQGRIVLFEAASLQKAIYAKLGDEYKNYLQNVELPGMKWNANMIEAYSAALVGMQDTKQFQQYFRNLIQSNSGH